MTARTRFAPSPTGSLHVGGVRTALYCLLHARRQGGRFVLRVEDTDQVRSTDESARGILADLEWCGLLWDEGPNVGGPGAPYFQSQRLDLYDRFVRDLLDSGHAYEAWDSKAELDALRKTAEAEKKTFRFKGGPVSPEQAAAYRAEGRVPVVRLHAPEQDLTVPDKILGDVTVSAADLEDVVIRKADGFPTYHFAVVVDDHEMGITDILRGQEHLLNTHKHLGIAMALGWELPAVGHLPLIFNPQGQKMSKREKAKRSRDEAKRVQKLRKEAGWAWLAQSTSLPEDEVAAFVRGDNDRIPVAEAVARALGIDLPMIEVMDFRRAGYLPEALTNYLALLGWNPGDEREILSLAELIESFSLDRVNRTPARFDQAKLKWMNGEYIRRASDERLLDGLASWLAVSPRARLQASTIAQREALIAMYRDRIDTFGELDEKSAFFLERPTSWDRKTLEKHVLRDGGLDRLRRCREVLAGCDWTPAAMEEALKPIAGDNLGTIAQPLRVALSGTAVTPPLFDTLAFFPRDEALARIDAGIAHAEGAGA